jgi:hypothetical protein
MKFKDMGFASVRIYDCFAAVNAHDKSFLRTFEWACFFNSAKFRGPWDFNQRLIIV